MFATQVCRLLEIIFSDKFLSEVWGPQYLGH